jgi:hypothetical protein
MRREFQHAAIFGDRAPGQDRRRMTPAAARAHPVYANFLSPRARWICRSADVARPIFRRFAVTIEVICIGLRRTRKFFRLARAKIQRGMRPGIWTDDAE